jgi:hypothetical protein
MLRGAKAPPTCRLKIVSRWNNCLYASRPASIQLDVESVLVCYYCGTCQILFDPGNTKSPSILWQDTRTKCSTPATTHGRPPASSPKCFLPILRGLASRIIVCRTDTHNQKRELHFWMQSRFKRVNTVLFKYFGTNIIEIQYSMPTPCDHLNVIFLFSGLM